MQDKGAYNGHFLLTLDESIDMNRLAAAIEKAVAAHPSDDDNAVKLYSEAVAVLKNDNIAENISLKVGVALEEMTVQMAKVNAGKIIDVDVRIKSELDKIIIAFRDNGKPFNPMEYQSHEDFNFDNIAMLKALSKNISYNRVLSLNQTIIEI